MQQSSGRQSRPRPHALRRVPAVAATCRARRAILLLEGAAGGAADAILPDGRVELIFHYSGSFRRHDDTRAVRQPASLLVGQMTAPVLLAPSGLAGIAAIRLRPEAARSLLRFPLRESCGCFETST